jgi:hypothetical protein
MGIIWRIKELDKKWCQVYLILVRLWAVYKTGKSIKVSVLPLKYMKASMLPRHSRQAHE